MKLTNLVETEVLGEEDVLVGQDYGIAADGMGMAIQAFYQYGKPIEAVVREVASNCFDSHREAKLIPTLSDDQLRALGYTGDLDKLRAHFSKWKERDVEIELVSPKILGDTQRTIVFRDFGVGISPSRMTTIMTKFFSSTKRATNDFIGAFGLGSKSPLGYGDSFMMTTWFFGTRYEYLIHRGSMAPRLELLSKTQDSRINGTEVIVPIKDERDFNSFRKAVIEQLRYFDGFRIKGVEGIKDSTVYRGKNFVFRNDGHVDQMHICFGKVYYPLAFDQVGLNGYHEGRVPIGLLFDIGELPVVWNRETIEYTQEAKATILARYKEAVQELQDLWDSQFKHIVTAEQFLMAFAQNKNSVLKAPNGSLIPNVGNILQTDVNWPNHLVTKDPFYAWEIVKSVTDGKTDKHRYFRHDLGDMALGKDGAPTFFFSHSGVSRPHINKWLCDELGHTNFVLVKRRFPFVLGTTDFVKASWHSWQLGKHTGITAAEAQKLLDTFLELEGALLVHSEGDYDSMELPEEYATKLREASRSRRQMSVKVPKEISKIRSEIELMLRPLSKWDGVWRYFKYSTTIGKVENAKCLIVYATQEHEESLKTASLILEQLGYSTPGRWHFNLKPTGRDSRIVVCKVAQDTQKILDEMANTIHVKAFLGARNGLWRRWLTSQLVFENWPQGTNVFSSAERFPNISWMGSIRKDINILGNYISHWKEVRPATDDFKFFSLKKREELMEAGWWDHDIVERWKRVKAYSERHRILRYLSLHVIPEPDLEWILRQQGTDNPELIYRNLVRKNQLITNTQNEDDD